MEKDIFVAWSDAEEKKGDSGHPIRIHGLGRTPADVLSLTTLEAERLVSGLLIILNS